MEEKCLKDDPLNFSNEELPKEMFTNSDKKKNEVIIENKLKLTESPIKSPNEHKKLTESQISYDKTNQSPKVRFSRFVGKIFGNNSQVKENDFEEYRKFNDKTNNINFNLLNYFFLKVKDLFCCSKSLKEKLFLKAHQIYDQEIDLVKILQRIQDIEKLKYLLLTEKQMALFNFLEKPLIIVTNDKNNEDSRMSNSKKIGTISQRDQAIEYYNELKKSENLDPIDKKLFAMVDKRFHSFKKYFKND